MAKLTYLLLGALLGSTAFGCKDDSACEKSRLDLAKTWEEVRNSAGELKYARGEAADKMDEGAKVDRLKRWEKMEEKAGLVQSAFISKQVTWDSANDARQELKKAVDKEPTSEALVDGFAKLVTEANQKYDTFQGKCR